MENPGRAKNSPQKQQRSAGKKRYGAENAFTPDSKWAEQSCLEAKRILAFLLYVCGKPTTIRTTFGSGFSFAKSMGRSMLRDFANKEFTNSRKRFYVGCIRLGICPGLWKSPAPKPARSSDCCCNRLIQKWNCLPMEPTFRPSLEDRWLITLYELSNLDALLEFCIRKLSESAKLHSDENAFTNDDLLFVSFCDDARGRILRQFTSHIDEATRDQFNQKCGIKSAQAASVNQASRTICFGLGLFHFGELGANTLGGKALRCREWNRPSLSALRFDHSHIQFEPSVYGNS